MKMEIVYPDDEEIDFRLKKYGGIQKILDDKIECTICNSDLLNEIVSKKVITVHGSNLFLCCYSCFYKLCDGNEFSCILCQTNYKLSNCEKCNLNVCKRCVENHKIGQTSKGILNKCFSCDPKLLWNQRALTANVLKLFSSQLDMPNGLLVNEIDRNQTVRNYLVKEAKIGHNSSMDNIKDHLCLKFLVNTYKMAITEKLSTFSPNIDDTSSVNECFNEFIEICEHILEKTCSTLTHFKRIFNLSTNLSPGVSAIMRSILKSNGENDSNEITDNPHDGKDVSVNKKSNANLKKDVTKNCVSDQSLNKKAENSILKNEQTINGAFPSKKNNEITSSYDESDTEKNETVHPLDLFGNISSEEEVNTRQLRSHKVTQNDKKEKEKQAEKSPKDKKKSDDKSDDEKEIDRLTRLSNIEKFTKTKIMDNESTDSNESTSIEKSQKNPKNKINNIEIMKKCVQNIDESDESDVENILQHEENLLGPVKNIFHEVRNSIDTIPVYSEENNYDSDASSLTDVINLCLSACNGREVDHYLKKKKDTQSNELDSTEHEENNEKSELSSIENENGRVTRSKQRPPLKMPSISNDSDSGSVKIMKSSNGKRRKLISSSDSFDNSDNSSDDSGSSSKYFKKSPKRIKKNKDSYFDSISSSSDESNLRPYNGKKRRQSKRIRSNSTDEENNDSSCCKSDDSKILTPTKKGRKNIRKVLKSTELGELTKNALKEEELRRKRIEERQKIYNKIFDSPKTLEACTNLVLDFDPETEKELIVVDPNLVKFLKPHQVNGVKFLWNSVFESLARIKEHEGSGALLAHCMGLGKTLQVITLIHTLFRYPETGIKTVLVITPNTTIENWCNEFHNWLKNIPEKKNFTVFNFYESKTYASRKKMIEDWRRKNGVLVSSYAMFRTVVNYKYKNKYPTILEGLLSPGPDLIICDEGHLLKNHASATSKAVGRIKTLRRIVLTGTPLQNNLKEYHCMVDFIRPNLLGSIKDFTNRFINPITNGQYSDSTPQDVKRMKRRSHVLHRMLEGFVQRCDYSVLTPFLPPKHEYVIYLKLSDLQIELYRYFLDNCRQPDLFNNYHILSMIWTHPKLLALYAKRVEKKKQKEKLKMCDEKFIDDESTSNDDSDSNSNSAEEDENEKIPIFETTKTKGPEMDFNWWKSVVKDTCLDTVHPFSKFLMMFSILKECEEIGDKVLIFSQSLFTLDLIQKFLENTEQLAHEKGGPYGSSWVEGKDYFRIDGSVKAKDREECCKKFNDVKNINLRLLLLSTKAFNLGINLVAANRVIIFDVTWNPSLNVQSIFRVFRFGQNKPCYIYRLVSEGTMEQKIYERQISKLSMAFRVVDEHQIDRHFNAQDQEILYEFEPNTTQPKTTLSLPKDRLMAELILKHKDLVMDLLEHDSLLQNNEAEELDENDRNAAWDDYQKEKDGLNVPPLELLRNQDNSVLYNALNSNNYPSTSQVPFQHFQSSEDVTLFNSLRKIFPKSNILQLNDMMHQVKLAQNVEQ